MKLPSVFALKRQVSFNVEAELLTTNSSEDDLQTQLTTVKSNWCHRKYLSVDDIDFTCTDYTKELSRGIYEIYTYKSEYDEKEDDDTCWGKTNASICGSFKG